MLQFFNSSKQIVTDNPLLKQIVAGYTFDQIHNMCTLIWLKEVNVIKISKSD